MVNFFKGFTSLLVSRVNKFIVSLASNFHTNSLSVTEVFAVTLFSKGFVMLLDETLTGVKAQKIDF